MTWLGPPGPTPDPTLEGRLMAGLIPLKLLPIKSRDLIVLLLVLEVFGTICLLKKVELPWSLLH